MMTITMTSDEIIRMAIKCQLVATNNRDGVYMQALERFAALVAEAKDKEIAELKATNKRDYEHWKWAAEQAAEATKAQPRGEPVAYRYKVINYLGNAVWTLATPRTDTMVLESQALYTTPPSVEAAIEATKEKAAQLCWDRQQWGCAEAIRSMK